MLIEQVRHHVEEEESELFDLLLGEASRTHAGHLRVRVGLARPRVPHRPEEVLDPPGNAPILLAGGL